MPSQINQSKESNDTLTKKILDLERKNELLEKQLASYLHSYDNNITNQALFLEQTNQIANVGGWDIDLINNKVYWTSVTRQIHEVEEPYIPKVETGILYYKEGYSRETITKLVQAAFENGTPFDVELQIVTAKGNERWVRAKGRVDFLEGKPSRLFGTFQDINEEKLHEQAYSAMQMKFQSAFYQSPFGMALVNESFKFEEVNEQLVKILGYTKEELLQMNLYSLFHSDDLEELLIFSQQSLSPEIGYGPTEKRFVDKDGQIVWVLLAITTINNNGDASNQLILQLKDISGRKAAEASLRKSEEQYKSLFEQNPAGVFSLNTQGYFVSANEAMVKSLGCSKELIVGNPFWKFVTPMQRESIAKKMQDALEGHAQNVEFEAVVANNDSMVVSLILLPIVVAGNITGIYGIATDITAAKGLKRALVNSENNLRAIFESTGIGHIMMDLHLNIVSFNKSALTFTEEIHHRTLEEQQPFLSYFPQERHQDLLITLKKVVKGESIEYEKELPNSLNELIWFKLKYNPIIDNKQQIVGILMRIENVTEQKKITEAIKIERNQLRTLIDNIPDAIYIKDNKARKTITNSVDLNFIGLASEKEVMGKTDLEIFEEDTGIIGYEDDMNIINTGLPVINKEQEFIAKDGSRRWLLTTKVPLRGEQNEVVGLLGIGRDITQQKLDQEALKKSNERFEYVTKATFDAIWDWDIKTNELYRGVGFETIFGYNFSTFTNTTINWDDFIHPDDKQRVLGKFNDVVNNDRLQWQEAYRFLKADGNYAFVINKAVVIKDDAGKSIRMIGAMQDITDQKNEEQQLRLFESVIKTINDAVLITEAELFEGDGSKIVFVNEAFTKSTGYSLEEVIGKTPRIFQGPKTDRKELNRLSTALKKWEPVEVELLNYKKNGEEFWVNLSITPIANEKGWFTHWISVQKDITEKKKTAKELAVFYEIASYINTNKQFDEILQNVITCIATYLEYDFAEAWSVNFDNSKMVYRAQYKNNKYSADWSGYSSKAVFNKGQGLSGIAMDQKKMIYWDNLQNSPSTRKESAAKAGLTSGMALPIFFDGEVIAAFSFYSRAPFNTQQLSSGLLSKISNEIGAGIQKNKAEAELNSFFKLSPDMLCIIDADGVFKKVNPAFKNILGYDEAEFLEYPLVNFLHPDDYERTIIEIDRLLKGHSATYFENRYITKHQEIKWLAWSFTVILDEGLLFAVAKDITYKRKLELERKRILESIDDCFYALDNNLNFTYINSAAEKLIGKSAENLMGKQIWDEFSELKNTPVYTNFINAVNTKEPISFEFFDKSTNNWFEENLYPTEDGLSVFFRSVNSRKQSEVKLKELNKALEKNANELASSNAELERFAYVASHDLQEPLRMVSGFMQLLQKKYDAQLDENGKKYIHYAIDGANRMKILIQDLLQYSRSNAEKLVLEPVDMNEVMADVKMILRTTINSTGAILTFQPLPLINANILLMNQLMQNLVGNAMKYQVKDNIPTIEVSCTNELGNWIFSVKDNGIGIPTGYEEKVFEVFQRLHTKQQYSGTGIGLSICKKIAEKLGGKIWVEANPLGGSIFKFNVPE